jgi:hypothetical protein
MGGRYEVRFEDAKQLNGYVSVYTNSWFEFMKLRLSKKVIYYKVFVS